MSTSAQDVRAARKSRRSQATVAGGAKPRAWHVRLARWISGARRIEALSDQIEVLRRDVHFLIRQQTAPPNGWKGDISAIEGALTENGFPCSTLCRQESFEQPFFAYWAGRIGLPRAYHRKIWEHTFICQALWERGALRPGAKGLGFGVGREPLSAFFASEDCQIVATDAAPELSAAQGWTASEQHAVGLETLRHPGICPDDQFERNVRFQVCDMNDIPEDLTGFDFCWSACAYEHLGSIEHGLRFVERSIDCLKPGGWAVHTTEYNVASNLDTVVEGPTVLFRRRDLEELARRLEAKGHKVAPLDFNPGTALLDGYVDFPPYNFEPHLKLAVAGYAATSFGIIVQRAA